MANGIQPALHSARLKAKVAIARLGVDSRRIDTIVNLPKIETWRKEHVPDGLPTFDERTEMFDHLHATLIGEAPIDYLEFGVYRGESIRHWSSLNTHPDSRFVGFDTFDGLPEDWQRFDGKMTKSTFDVEGTVPNIDDERVSFVRGLFQDSLDPFRESFTPRSQLVVHVDSDLYSSALYTLTHCDDMLVPGTIVMFDEFSSVLNEFAALRDYCSAYRRSYEVLASAWTYFGHLAIRMQ